MSKTKVKPILEVNECTAGEAGTCCFCNENIGSHGVIDHDEIVYEIKGNSTSVRFCVMCLSRFQKAVWVLSQAKLDSFSAKH
jgi:hypothetical protein